MAEKIKPRFSSVQIESKMESCHIEEHHQLVQKLDADNEELRRQLQLEKDRVRELEMNLQTQKEANERAPTVAMKGVVEKLKQQLEIKEQELQVIKMKLE